MQKLVIATSNKKEIIDLADDLSKLIRDQSWKQGLLHLFVKHTTAALTTADLDPGTDKDMLDAFAEMIPKLDYRHPHDPSHVGDHIISSVIGSSIWLPVQESQLVLGTWQRPVLVESNGPKQRTLIASFFEV